MAEIEQLRNSYQRVDKQESTVSTLPINTLITTRLI